ncbi:MAG: signal peptidase I [Acidimicrobiales bacterium]
MVVLVALGVAFGIKTFLIQPYYIPSASMTPTLAVGDRILVNKVAYHLHGVHRGDIVVFAKPPRDQGDPKVKDLVKRVIGLPGETISSASGHVLINGVPLQEPYLPNGVNPGPPITKQVIPANHYFMMGDNRGDSKDSRFFGPVDRSLFVGHVFMRVWPVSRIHIF